MSEEKKVPGPKLKPKPETPTRRKKDPCYLIADPGSTHMGNKALALQHVRLAKENGFNAVKFQLFEKGAVGNNYGNRVLPLETFIECVNLGKEISIDVSASVFGDFEDPRSWVCNILTQLFKLDLPWIKVAYSQVSKFPIQHVVDVVGRNVIATFDMNTLMEHRPDIIRTKRMLKNSWFKKLWTYTIHGQTVYPVNNILHFNGLFPLFDGFSDHTLGYEQARFALKAGAKIIEKHVTLNEDSVWCPDHAFSLRPEEAREFVDVIRIAENE